MAGGTLICGDSPGATLVVHDAETGLPCQELEGVTFTNGNSARWMCQIGDILTWSGQETTLRRKNLTTLTETNITSATAGVIYHGSTNDAGTKLALAHDTTPFLSIYSIPAWTKDASTPNPGAQANCVGYSNAALGKLAVGLNGSPWLRVYNTSDYSLVSIPSPPTSYVEGLDFSPNGNYLAVSGYDFAPIVFNTSTWARITLGTTPTGGSYQVKFSPDSSLMAYTRTSGSNLSLRVYETATWTQVFASGTLATDWPADGMAWSADGSKLFLAFGFGDPGYVFDSGTWADISAEYPIDLTNRNALAVSSEQMAVVQAGTEEVLDDAGMPISGGVVRLYRRDTGALIAEDTTDASGKYGMATFLAGTGDELQVVFLEPDGGTLYNDLIHRVII